MFFNNSDNDPYGDLRRREEYERQQQVTFARGLGNFFFKSLGYWFVWLFTAGFSGSILQKVFGFSFVSAFLVGLILSFLIFKVPYVKENPYKSFVMICFIFALFVVAFP
jgi:hypothetical protein